jgi:REP element-mobilizing transposase RayT
VGQVVNLRPIGNRPIAFTENFAVGFHFLIVTEFHTRRLPHWHAFGRSIFLTWRLHGSLPVSRRFPTKISSGQAFVAMERLLDNAMTGPRYLGRPEIAVIVEDAIVSRHGRQYELHCWVVMPNHVHLLITPLENVSKAMQSLKRFTARECNRAFGLTGQPFWQEESYDRLVRDSAEFARIARYIEMNPVKCGLALTPEEFPWSSARPIANRPQVDNLPHH